MAGGRFGSSIVYPYTTSKVWENQCGAAASITVTGTSLNDDAQRASIIISDQGICASCCTLLGTSPSTYDYNDVTSIYYINSCYQGMRCSNTAACSYFHNLTYVDCTNTAFTPTTCYSGMMDYYTPVPYISSATIPSTGCTGNKSTRIPISATMSSAWLKVTCLDTAGGSLPYNCHVKNLMATTCACACVCCSYLDTTGTVGCVLNCVPDYPNLYAIDYWGISKAYMNITYLHCWYVTYLNTDAAYCINCLAPCQFSCNNVCCQCTMYTSLMGGSCCTINCFAATSFYPCCDRYLAQRVLVAGCNLFAMQPFHNSCNCMIFATMCAGDPSWPCCAGYWSGTNMRLRYSYTGDKTLAIKWMTYNHVTGKNVFMWWHANTPEWNGIYDVSQTQQCCIQTTSRSCCCCFIYPEGFCTDYFTKIADVPAAWCAIGSYDLTTTTPVAISDTEFMVRVGHLDDGLTGDMTRYTTTDFITWTPTNDQYYGACLSSNTAVIGNTTHTQYVVNNYGSLDKAGAVENCTCAINIERTGVVVNDGDSIYVTNHTSGPMAFTAWGYTE